MPFRVCAGVTNKSAFPKFASVHATDRTSRSAYQPNTIQLQEGAAGAFILSPSQSAQALASDPPNLK